MADASDDEREEVRHAVGAGSIRAL
jgi:hypothetical protein